jgi:hypothetical protein
MKLCHLQEMDELEIIVLNETEKDKYYIFSLI